MMSMMSIAVGEFVHPCEGEMVCKSTIDKVPYFNAPVYLENKTMIGKVDEILGPINEFVSHMLSMMMMILLRGERNALDLVSCRHFYTRACSLMHVLI